MQRNKSSFSVVVVLTLALAVWCVLWWIEFFDTCIVTDATPIRVQHYEGWTQISYVYVNGSMQPMYTYHPAYDVEVYQGKWKKTGEPCECEVNR